MAIEGKEIMGLRNSVRIVEREREGDKGGCLDVCVRVREDKEREREVALLIWVTIVVVKKTPNFFSIFFTPVCVCGVCV